MSEQKLPHVIRLQSRMFKVSRGTIGTCYSFFADLAAESLHFLRFGGPSGPSSVHGGQEAKMPEDADAQRYHVTSNLGLLRVGWLPKLIWTIFLHFGGPSGANGGNLRPRRGNFGTKHALQ